LTAAYVPAISTQPVSAAQHARNVQTDAQNFKNAVDTTMTFHTCAICEHECGTAQLTKLSDCMARINLSDMKILFDDMIAPLSDPLASVPDKAYAQAAMNELNSPGLLKDAEYVCNTCYRQLPKLPTTNTTSARTTSAASLIDSESHAMVAEDVEEDEEEFENYQGT
jgi:hypothetical protein